MVTGGGGVLGSYFAKALAECGARVAILDLNEEAAQKVTYEINHAGGVAISVTCNVLDIESIKAAKDCVDQKLGAVEILPNGAGGNNSRGSTVDEYYDAKVVKNNPDLKTFFGLDPEGVQFVFI